jgi:hypothetical protein
MGTRSSWSLILTSLAGLLALGGCSPGPPIVWHEVHLPVAGDGRPEVTSLASCSGHYYAAGAYVRPDGATTPALWTSTDATHWTAVPTRAVSAYGPANRLSAVACRGETVVSVGSAAGGVHGNLRTSTWYSAYGAPLTETAAPFELFGGPRAIGVDRIIAGPRGWLIVGARTDANGLAGAAVWYSPDGHAFQLVDADPALESDPRGQTVAFIGYARDDGFAVVGSTGLASRTPLAWTSPDGLHWQRTVVPASEPDAELQKMPEGWDDEAVGLAGRAFGHWYRDGSGGWHELKTFGAFSGTGLPAVLDIVGYAVLVTDGAEYQPLPERVTSGHAAMTGSSGNWLLLALDDGKATRLWTAGL